MFLRDGKADYVWTRGIDGVAKVWYNQYAGDANSDTPPGRLGWREGGVFASGVGANGDNVRYAVMDATTRSSYIVLDPATGALAAWLNGCDNDCIDPFTPCCPDPFSPCEYLGDDGCIFGYEACLQANQCQNKPGDADCIGTSTGTFSLVNICPPLTNTRMLGCDACSDHKAPAIKPRSRRGERRASMVWKL